MERNPSTDESAAIAAAIARFQVETAPVAPSAGDALGPWQRAALSEGVGAKGALQKHREGGERWQS